MDSPQNMETNTMENIDSINYLRERVDVIQRSLSDVRLPKSEDEDDGRSDSVGISTEISTSISEKLDSIKSCESILKIFSFEPREFNKKNEKCLEFWNLINNHPEIQPVNCVIMDAQKNKRDKECQTEQEESEASLWARALHELQKKKLHQAAMATAPNPCKYCKDPEDSYEVSDNDNLSELNAFSPHHTVLIKTDSTPSKSSAESDNKEEMLTKKHESSKGKQAKATDEHKKPKIHDELPLHDSVITAETSMSDTDSYHTTKKYISEVTVDNLGERSRWESATRRMTNEMMQQLSDALQVLKDEGALQGSANILQEIGEISLPSKGITESWKYPTSREFIPTIPCKQTGPVGEKTEISDQSKESVGGDECKSSKRTEQEAKGTKHCKKVRDSYTYAQNVLSLLNIDMEKYQKATAIERNRLLQDTLKENYSKYIKKDPKSAPTTLSCPCHKELQERTRSYCTCEAGVCKITKEMGTEDLDKLTKFMPHGPGLECINLMIEGLKRIRTKDLTIEQTSVEVRKLLKSVQDRDIRGGPCKCPLHQINLSDIDEQIADAKFMKDTLYNSLDDALNEKYGSKLGVWCVGKCEDKSVEFDANDIETAGLLRQKTMVCIMCGAETCRCGKSKYAILD